MECDMFKKKTKNTKSFCMTGAQSDKRFETRERKKNQVMKGLVSY